MADRSADGFLKNRLVLGDVSNQLGKRRFVSVSSNSGTNSGGDQKNMECESGKSLFPFPRKDIPGVENIGKGKCVFEFGGKGDSSVLKAKQLGGSWSLETEAKNLQENLKLGISQIPSEMKANQFGGSPNVESLANILLQKGAFNISRVSNATKEPFSLSNGDLPFASADAVKKPSDLMPRVPSENVKDCSSPSLGAAGQFDEGVGIANTRNLVGSSNEVNNVCESSDEGMDAGDLTSNKSSSIEGSTQSPVSKESESEKCSFFNCDGTSSNVTGMDLLKTCSCSFCLKAAYIWSDLQYQDTKGRIAALKRSRKDVRSVIEKSCSYGGFGKTVQGNSSKPTKLEHDLMAQWRSLFLHTEDVLIRESTQLQSSLFTLKELREKCKADLEMTNATSSNS